MEKRISWPWKQERYILWSQVQNWKQFIKKILVSTDECSINGYMYDLWPLGEVKPYTNSIGDSMLSFSTLREKGIDPEGTMKAKFTWYIFESDTLDNIDKTTECSMTF